MKKILGSIIALILLSTAVYASNPKVDYSSLHKLNKNDVFTILTGYINADEAQAQSLLDIVKVSDVELYSAEKNKNDKRATYAVYYNLYNAKNILTEEQYRKYLVFVNYYLKNDNLLSLNSK